MTPAPRPPRGYDWDRDKNQINVDQHGLPFELAPFVFHPKTPAVTFDAKGTARDQGQRRVAIARLGGRDIKTVYVQNGGERRIISMHSAKPNEVDLLERYTRDQKQKHTPRNAQEIRTWLALGVRQRAAKLPLTRDHKQIADRERSAVDKQAHRENWSKERREKAYRDLRAKHRARTEPVRRSYQPKLEAERATTARTIEKKRMMTNLAGRAQQRNSPGQLKQLNRTKR